MQSNPDNWIVESFNSISHHSVGAMVDDKGNDLGRIIVIHMKLLDVLEFYSSFERMRLNTRVRERKRE